MFDEVIMSMSLMNKVISLDEVGGKVHSVVMYICSLCFIQ